MKATASRWCWFAGALLLATGCATTSNKQLKPPKHPEEFVLPPEQDARFSAFQTYPKNVMGNDRIKQEQAREAMQPQGVQGPGPRRPGASGMSGSGF